MKKSLQSFLLMAFMLLVGSSAWAADALTKSLKVTGYKAVNLLDFQNKDYDGTALSSFNELPGLGVTAQNAVGDTYGNNNWYNDTSNNRGLRLNSGGGRWIQFSVDIKKDDYIIINGGTTNEAYEISMTNGESVAITQASGYLCFKATQDADNLRLTAHRYNYLLQILIMTKDESAATASYTLNYINGSLTVKSVNGEMAVGATVPTEASFFVDDVKYFRGAGEPEGFTIAAEGGNNFSVKVRAAETYNYSLVSSLGETLASGSGIEGETVYVGYPRYQLKEGKFYEAAVTNKEYRKPIVLSENNVSVTVDYAEWNGANPVVFYAEGEDLDGFSTSVAINIPVRASQAKAGVAAEDVTITTLPAGKYKLHVGIFTSKSAYEGNVVKFGLGSAIFEASFVGVNLNETVSDEITVTGNSDVKFIAEGSWDGAQFDYIWIEKTGEAVTSYAIVYADGMVGGSVTGPVSSAAGEKVTPTVSPDAGYQLKTLKITCADSGNEINYDVADYSFTMPAEGVTIFAEFERVYPIIYADGMVGGSVTGSVSSPAGEKITLTVTPNAGYQLKTLKITCADSGNEINYDVADYSFTMPAEGVTIFAEFEEVYPIIYADGMVGGKVTGSDGSAAGEKVTLTVTPNAGYELNTLTITCADSGNEINYDITEYSFTMPAEGVRVFASFVKIYNIIYPNSLVGGKVTGSVSSAADEKVTLTVTPNAGYQLKTLKITCADSGNEINYDVADYSFTMPAEGVTIFAEFEEVYPIIYADGMVGGSVTGSVSSPAGEKITLTVTPNAGYQLKTLKITCADSGNEINYDVADYSFTMPAEGVTIFAEFEEVYPIIYSNSMVGGLVDGPDGSAAGAKVKLYVLPIEGYVLKTLTITCTNSGNEINYDVTDYSFTMPAEGVTIFAEFEEVYPIIYANGMVGGIVTGSDRSVAGKKITLTVTPEDGYECEKLTITCANSGNEINYDVKDYSFTMPAEGVKVFAEFVRIYPIIYADGMVGGKVEGPVAASADTEIDLVVTPDEGYTLKTLKITCADSGNEINYDVTDYSFTMPAEGVKIFAEFGKVYSIAYPVGTQGGTVAGSTSAFAGDKVKLNVVPNEGYELESLTITCDNSGNEINYDVVDFSFTMPAEGVHVFATFQPSSKVEIAHEIATYCSLKNLDFTNEDVKAYIVSAFTPSTSEAVLTRVYDVPAGTGLVLIGENGSYEIPEGTGATVVSNLLKGVTSATVLNAVDETNTNFILTTGEYDLGFYPVLDGTTLAAGKAYLPLPTESLPLTSGAGIRFVFEDSDEATYINGVAIGAAGSKMEKGVYYNLNGQRVGRPTKAGIYILDGKKVYVK